MLDSALIQDIDSVEDIADDAPGQFSCEPVAIQPHPQQNIRNVGLLEAPVAPVTPRVTQRVNNILE